MECVIWIGANWEMVFLAVTNIVAFFMRSPLDRFTRKSWIE